MQDQLISQGLIPLDKSWTIRMGMLDLVHHTHYTLPILQQHSLGNDLFALQQALHEWPTQDIIHVGESGTLYRFLQYLSWKEGADKEFIKEGTLLARAITYNPKIITYPIAQLLHLDHGTSQWASAALLSGHQERIMRPPYHLAMTYEALDHWNTHQKNGKPWETRFDQTILKQAKTFMNLQQGKLEFIPEQPEDYCFARAFGFITLQEGLQRWPSLQGHESNRIEEMERALEDNAKGREITTQDHRIIQAIAMKNAIDERTISFTHPEAVRKSWPQFWNFLEYVQRQ